MENKIKEILSHYKGVFGVIIKDSFGNRLAINENEVFPSASIIKLFILNRLAKEDYDKIVELTKEVKVGGCGVLKSLKDGLMLTTKDLAYLMICLSDNTATNLLIDYVGMDNVNQYSKENGYLHTILGRKMMDTEAKKAGRDNFTSPKDVERILDILCDDKDCLDMLKNQACNNKLPLYLPEEAELAHKTGELTSIEHDVGRLYFEKGWVDIIVLTKELLDNADGKKVNNEIGKVIYDYYKQQKE